MGLTCFAELLCGVDVNFTDVDRIGREDRRASEIGCNTVCRDAINQRYDGRIIELTAVQHVPKKTLVSWR